MLDMAKQIKRITKMMTMVLEIFSKLQVRKEVMLSLVAMPLRTKIVIMIRKDMARLINNMMFNSMIVKMIERPLRTED